LKIVHIISNFSLPFGGMAVACKEIAEGQVKAGLDVTVITSYLDFPSGILNKPNDKPVFENGVRVIYCSVFFKPLVFSFQLIKHIKKELRESDIVHVHGLYRFPQSYACWYSRRIKKPYILSPHGSLDPVLFDKKERKLLRRLYQYLFEIKNVKKSKKIHFTANDELELANYLDIKEKSVVIPNGIDTIDFKNLPNKGGFVDTFKIQESSFKILFLGRVVWKKGLDILLTSLPSIIKKIPNVSLIIAGPDNENYKKDLTDIINSNGINSYVKFIGMLNREKVKQAYVNADIFILPSYSENYGITIVESLVCGCPVIISKNVNIHKEITYNNLGQVIDCDPKDISDAVINYFNRSDDYKIKHRAYIRDYALQKYDWENAIKKFSNLYEEILVDKKI
tara:strand:- start:4825 stop:6009 length:1185 start_codon:yes stop_codon:yes gene_type:complete